MSQPSDPDDHGPGEDEQEGGTTVSPDELSRTGGPTISVSAPAKGFSLFKLSPKLAIVASVIVAATMLTVFTVIGRSHKVEPSKAKIAATLPDAQSGNPMQQGENYADLARQHDKSVATAARKMEGTSAVSYVPTVAKDVNDPLARYSANSGSGFADSPPPPPRDATRQGRDLGQAQPVSYHPSGEPSAPRPDVEALVTAMHQMAAESDKSVGHMSFEERDVKDLPASDSSGNGAANVPATPESKLVKLGQMVYAAMDFEANSDDQPYFAQATIIGGPYKGARLQGSFSKGEDCMGITFNRVSWKDANYAIKAMAVDMDQRKVCVATDVNHHYLLRGSGIFLSGAFSAVGSVIANEGTTTSGSSLNGQVTTTTPKLNTRDLILVGAGGVANDASGLAKQLAMTPTTITEAAQTPIGVLFLDDWIDKPADHIPDAATASDDSGKVGGGAKTQPGYTTAAQAANLTAGSSYPYGGGYPPRVGPTYGYATPVTASAPTNP